MQKVAQNQTTQRQKLFSEVIELADSGNVKEFDLKLAQLRTVSQAIRRNFSPSEEKSLFELKKLSRMNGLHKKYDELTASSEAGNLSSFELSLKEFRSFYRDLRANGASMEITPAVEAEIAELRKQAKVFAINKNLTQSISYAELGDYNFAKKSLELFVEGMRENQIPHHPSTQEKQQAILQLAAKNYVDIRIEKARELLKTGDKAGSRFELGLIKEVQADSGYKLQPVQARSIERIHKSSSEVMPKAA